MDLNDRIGRTEFVTKVKNIVKQLKPDNHICIAINGEWGSGKTFVMEMLDESFTVDRNCIFVRYDAWKNNFYSDPLIAILYCVLDVLSKEKGADRFLHLIRKEVKKLAKEKATKWEKNQFDTIVNNLYKTGGIGAVCAFSAEVIKNVIKQAKSSILDNKLFDDFKSYQSLLNESISALNALTSFADREKPRKLIILVDEIDRCLPNEQLIVLERLHHLFEVKNCAVIVALNQTCVIKTIRNLYGTSGEEYLRKFFDFSFKLDTSSELYLSSIYNDLTEKLENVLSKQTVRSAVNSTYFCLLRGSKQILRNVDNRELSRYRDALESVFNDFGWENLTREYIFFSVVALYIRKNIDSKFLNKDIVQSNQQKAYNIYINSNKNFNTMPYYDYIKQYIGVDRTNLPTNLSTADLAVSQNVWDFNAIVATSIGDTDIKFMGCQIDENNRKDCEKLRELIIVYGGESEREDQ